MIHVNESLTRSALHPIPHFWSTSHMNFITSKGVCCAYPSLTFHARGLLTPLCLDNQCLPSSSVLLLIRKYEQRGFQFSTRAYALYPGASLKHASVRPLHNRGFEDKECFTLQFDTTEGNFVVGDPLVVSTDCKVGWRLGGFCPTFLAEHQVVTFCPVRGMEYFEGGDEDIP